MRCNEWITIIISCLCVAQMLLYVVLLCIHETSFKKGFHEWIIKNTTLSNCTETNAGQYLSMVKDYIRFGWMSAGFIIVTVIFLFVIPRRMCLDWLGIDDRVCLTGIVSFGCIMALDVAIYYIFALIESESALAYESADIKYPLQSSSACCSVHEYIVGEIPSPHKLYYEMNSISAYYTYFMASNSRRNGSCCCYDNVQVISVHTLASYMDLLFILFIFGLFFQACLGLTSEDNSIELEKTSGRWTQFPKTSPKNLSCRCVKEGVRIECWLVLSLVKVRAEDGWYLVRVPDYSQDDSLTPIRTSTGGFVVIIRTRHGRKIKSLILVTVENNTRKQVRIGDLRNDGSFLIYLQDLNVPRNMDPEILEAGKKNLKAISCFDTSLHRRMSLHYISNSLRQHTLGYGDWIDVKFHVMGYSPEDSFRVEFSALWNETVFVIHMKGNIFHGFAFIRSPSRVPEPFHIIPGQNLTDEGPAGFYEVTLPLYRPLGSRIRPRRITPEIANPEFFPNIQIM